MKALFPRLVPQPLLATVLSTLALCGLGWSWTHLPPLEPLGWLQAGGLALCLAGAVVVADYYPIHIDYHTKANLSTIPLYLMAVLLPPPLAALTAGTSILVVALLQRAHTGLLPSDIATASNRSLLVVLAGGLLAHLDTASSGQLAGVLFGTALVMFVGDCTTIALEIGAAERERPSRVLKALVRQAALIETVSYLVAILASLAALHHLWSLGLLVVPIRVVYIAFKNTKELHDSTRRLLENMADAVDLRDLYTGGHSRRVTEYAQNILRELGLHGPDVDLIITAARVHDIGKIAVPDAVLNKPGKLNDDEWAVMASHAAVGADFLARHTDFARGVPIVRHHHERWDGKGYPDQLTGLDIPFGARVIAVADSFDAMTSDRPYRAGMPVAKAAQILHDGRGTQWDTRIVDAFLRSIAPQLAETPIYAPIEAVQTPTVGAWAAAGSP